MESLQKFLTVKNVTIDQILLDPNNPRFSELGEKFDLIPESRFSETRIQDSAFDKMKNGPYGVVELRDTIKTIGFLPMDRIVIRNWKHSNDTNKMYVVIEGNRRVSAIKWLHSLHLDGKLTLNEDQLDNLTNLQCLLLADDAPITSTLVLPGLRHISGIKEWGAYQKAKAIFELRRNQNLPPNEAAQCIGLSTRAANKAYKCYLALEYMKADEEVGEFAEPKYYTYFDEVFKKAEVKNWLGWNDITEQFENIDNLKDFYSWIVKTDECDSKIKEAKDIRELAMVVSDKTALHVFKSENGSLTRALSQYQTNHPDDWMVTIDSAVVVLKNLTIESLTNAAEQDIEKLNQLIGLIQQRLTERKKLL